MHAQEGCIESAIGEPWFEEVRGVWRGRVMWEVVRRKGERSVIDGGWHQGGGRGRTPKSNWVAKAWRIKFID